MYIVMHIVMYTFQCDYNIPDINKQWEKLNDLVEDKRIELLSIISLQQFKNSIQYCVVSYSSEI